MSNGRKKVGIKGRKDNNAWMDEVYECLCMYCMSVLKLKLRVPRADG